MSLWVDKHRPKKLSKLDYNDGMTQLLKKLAMAGDFPHLLFCGPPGAGKKTRIMCLLRELYGPGVERLRIEHQEFTTPSNKKIELSSLASNYHIEVNPSDAGVHDRVVIQEIIKKIAQTSQLETGTQKDFKVVLLSEVDRLTRDAQHALRRTMEKYTATCRLILCCTSLTKVTPAVKSRCLIMRVPAPTTDQISNILVIVCKREGLNLPKQLAERIAKQAERNLRRALLMCETTRVRQYPFTVDQELVVPDWQQYLKQTAAMILEEQSPKRLLEVRARLYELLVHCIPTNVIIRGLVDSLVTSCDSHLKSEVIQMAARYEHRLQLGQKAIFHLEAFVAKFMHTYKLFIERVAAVDLGDDDDDMM